MLSLQSALVVLVPEAEMLVAPFRRRHDPSASTGMPAHVTVLYPFKPPDAIDGAFLRRLDGLFRQFEPFPFTLTTIRRFPDEALYLAIEPERPFRRLTQAVWDLAPETPPYGGRYSDLVPHLTVAQVRGELHLDRIAAELERAAAGPGTLPIRAAAAEVTLLDTRPGRWAVRAAFALALQ